MSTYHYLLNDTKRELVHLDHHVKWHMITDNPAVAYALCKYMLQNMGDTLRMLSDSFDDDALLEYTEVDLLKYRFEDEAVIPRIVEILNQHCGRARYMVVDGLGVDPLDRD